MSVLRFIAVMIIFGCVSVAWMILGATMSYRTNDLDEKLSKEMDNLWGPAVLSQPWPCLQENGSTASSPPSGQSPRELALASNDIQANITHQTRNRGLLWFNTFSVDFKAKYTTPVLPPENAAKSQGSFTFPLPAYATRFDTLAVLLDDKPVTVRPADMSAGKISLAVDLATSHIIDVAYKTHGRDMWLYAPVQMNKDKHERDDYEAPPINGSATMSQLNNFSLTIDTDFEDIDYPKGTSSPTTPAQKANGGRSANWTYTSAMTRQAMGVVVPRPVNAGPVAARMSYFAPVSLFFFFTVLFVVVVLKKVQLHPMHYLFISAGFFAFHILMAYLVDMVDIQAAFWICAAVSVLLVVSYMRLVAGAKFAVLFVAAAQLVYLVGFSYAFLTPGKTGLMITIGAILTLFVLMQATGKTNWFDILKPKPKFPPLPRVPAPIAPAPATGGPSSPPISELSQSPWPQPPNSGSSRLDGPEGNKQ